MIDKNMMILDFKNKITTLLIIRIFRITINNL